MNRYAWASIGICIAGAAASVGLASATAAAWAQGGPLFWGLAFLSGPEVFLALIAWRRRYHASRSRMLCGVALLVVLSSLALLGYDFIRFLRESPDNHATHNHPLILLTIQWGGVLAIWLGLVFLEGMEKQAAKKTA